MSLMINGTGLSKGIVIGQADVIYGKHREIKQVSINSAQIEDESLRFRTAIDHAQEHLRGIRDRTQTNSSEEISNFIDMHLLILQDPIVIEGTINNIMKLCCNAEWALHLQSTKLVQVFEDMDDAYMRTRKYDIIHVADKIQAQLANEDYSQQFESRHLKDRIIITDDLTPTDILLLHQQKIAGFVTEFGGALSHTAILSRSLGIPAIIGVHNVRKLIPANETIIINARNGLILSDIDQKTILVYRSLQRNERTQQLNLNALKGQPTVSSDAVQVTLEGNIDRTEDVKLLRLQDNTGVGLFRTEMLFLENNEMLPEQEQFQFYKRTLRALKGKPLTIRTIDIGADKELQDTEYHGPMAHNPAMGLRAIRRCLKQPELLLPQLRAILRTSALGPVRIMIPMLTTISEARQTLALIEQAKNDLQKRKLKFDASISVGGMIEVPAAALIASAFAKELDFLSIGTNDLIQYTLAIDRIDDEVNYLYNPLHPAVLKLIQMIIDAGEKENKPVSMCGEMASDPGYTRLLLGMGLKNFSVQSNTLLEIKHIINTSNTILLRKQCKKILACDQTREAEQLLYKLNIDALN